MALYRGALIYSEYKCGRCRERFDRPVLSDSDEGSYNACPFCGGLFINKRYFVDGEEGSFSSRYEAECFVDENGG